MTNLTLQIATQHHFEDIWSILSDSFQGPQSRYTAIGQPGFRTYLADFLQKRNEQPKLMAVGISQGQVAAFADFTIRDKAPNFLTRIAVKPAFRGLGIAPLLMTKIQDSYGHHNQWELDVFESNSSARRLYAGLGFEVIATSFWIGRDLAPSKVSECNPSSTPADPDYSRYGFTRIQMEKRTFSIVGESVRCHEIDSFKDIQLLSMVQDRYPEVNRAFVLTEEPNHSLPAAHHYLIERSLRMRGSFKGTQH